MCVTLCSAALTEGLTASKETRGGNAVRTSVPSWWVFYLTARTGAICLLLKNFKKPWESKGRNVAALSVIDGIYRLQIKGHFDGTLMRKEPAVPRKVEFENPAAGCFRAIAFPAERIKGTAMIHTWSHSDFHFFNLEPNPAGLDFIQRDVAEWTGKGPVCVCVMKGAVPSEGSHYLNQLH